MKLRDFEFVLKLTLGGPIIIPVQWVRVISSSFSKPQLIVPSPTPFWPCSSSSSKRKFLGTTATTIKISVKLINKQKHHFIFLILNLNFLTPQQLVIVTLQNEHLHIHPFVYIFVAVNGQCEMWAIGIKKGDNKEEMIGRKFMIGVLQTSMWQLSVEVNLVDRWQTRLGVNGGTQWAFQVLHIKRIVQKQGRRDRRERRTVRSFLPTPVAGTAMIIVRLLLYADSCEK